jgi:hypothetical protein
MLYDARIGGKIEAKQKEKIESLSSQVVVISLNLIKKFFLTKSSI